MLAALALVASGCGEGGGEDTSVSLGGTPEPSGTLRIAVADQIRTLDPLLADDRAERLASRQVHEPLFSTQSGPFGGARRRPGLVRSFRSNPGDTIWTAKLRSRIRFQNGELLDADAVIANAERWLALEPGRELLPELFRADNPRPGLVRFILDRPAPHFPRELGSARLGIVAPSAIPALGPLPLSSASSGTGPFEIRERDGGRTLLARNADWWGTEVDLGPGVVQIELLELADAAQRVDALTSGAVEVADRLNDVAARRVESSPLLDVVGGGGSTIGLERSVRGIESAEADQPLSDAWLTDLR